MRVIGVVTVARSDYGIYRPLLRAIAEDPDLTLHLIVSGMHLSPEYGLTVREIKADGFRIGERVEMLLSSDSPEGIAKSMGLGVIGYAQSFTRVKPDILVLLGDRFEMHAAAVAALSFKIPVAHIHGGEITQGAIDDALRHSTTKLSHLHFVATEAYERRVLQMGEERWRVKTCGALSLDNIHTVRLLDRSELESEHNLQVPEPVLLVTFHPVTLEYESVERQFGEVLAALDAIDIPVLFTAPNADTGGRVLFDMIDKFLESHATSRFAASLGTQAYFSMLALTAAMVGNSSSGIIEAASFGLPVVNVGTRQDGRIKAANVIDVPCHRDDIEMGIKRALSPAFLEGLAGLTNPYYQGGASDLIVETLKTVSLDAKLIVKRFKDVECGHVRPYRDGM